MIQYDCISLPSPPPHFICYIHFLQTSNRRQARTGHLPPPPLCNMPGLVLAVTLIFLWKNIRSVSFHAQDASEDRLESEACIFQDQLGCRLKCQVVGRDAVLESINL